MAPLNSNDLNAPLLSARDYYCRNGYYSSRNCNSSWSYYGRWILAAVLLGICILFLLWACINSRRRRRNGVKPMYGTGWMAPPPPYNNPQGYGGPPPYVAPPGQSYPMNPQPTGNTSQTGNTFQTGDGYYGHHEGIQQPKNTYAPAGADDYAPPPGPPPTSRP